MEWDKHRRRSMGDTVMDAKQAFRELRGGNVRPVYICYGTEPYFMNEFT
jgi:hypothetical protein